MPRIFDSGTMIALLERLISLSVPQGVVTVKTLYRSSFGPFCKTVFIISIVLMVPAGLSAFPGVSVEQVIYGKSIGIVFDTPAGIFYDVKKHEIYVTDSGNSNVLIFNSSGDFLFSFTHWVRRGGENIPGEPRDIVVNNSGIMYLTDALSQEIDVLNPRGVSIDRILPGSFKPFIGKMVYPQYMAIDQWDTLFVTLGGDAKEVLVLDPRHRLVRRITGTDEGFGVLTGIALHRGKDVIVTDAKGPTCVKIFSRKGDLRREFGLKAIGDENFSHPHGVACTGDGDIWVVDSFRQVLKRFSEDGTLKEMTGGFGVKPGDMQYPMGIATDGVDGLCVVEKVGRRFQMLRVK